MRPVARFAVDPAAAQAGARGAKHVRLDVVAHVQHLARRALQSRARGVEDAGLGLGRTVLARAEIEMEVVSQPDAVEVGVAVGRSEEHTSELQSLMRISYA